MNAQPALYRLLYALPAITTLTTLPAVLPAQARVTKIVIDSTTPVTGQTLAYERIRGRAFGELDPNDPMNGVITDIQLGQDADGKVRFEATFTLIKPVHLAQASGFLWHDVPNRGGVITPNAAEFTLGDINLSSGWQADNAGAGGGGSATAIPANHATGTNHWVQVPMAKVNGQLVTGKVLARIVNRSGPDSTPLNVMGNPVPYLPATLDTSQAVLTTRLAESVNGRIVEGSVVPAADWDYATCSGANAWATRTRLNNDTALLPGNLPVHVCLRHGFDPNLLYQLVYRAKGAYLLGVGVAAFRDVGSFFKYQTADDFGTPNPIAGRITASSMRGSSQSGNFIRQFIYMGMNQDEAARIVHNGAWPQIAGRRVAANVRWGQPDGVLELYQLGSEGPQWWTDFPDLLRGNPAKGIFTRCNASATCPKVVEHFGSAEVYALKMTMEWVGSSADTDIALTRNVRRYYIPSTTHGGGAGGFTWQPPAIGVNCPGNNWGTGTLRANPMPVTQMVNLIRVAMRDWLMRGIAPPPGRYPTLTGGNLVEPTQAAMGFPSGVPTVDYDIFRPENFIFPVFDYDWGPDFDRSDASGVPTNLPPPILQAIPMKVPRADADGNEVGGVPTVLNMAPLGTYLGWNITAAGFHRGQVCNYVGGYIPFALTQADRLANGDPRLSLTERYGNHDGYVAAVTAAANSAFAQGYLLAADRDALIAEAQASTVLLPASAPGSTRDTRDTRSLAAAPQLPRSPMHPRSTGIAVHQPLSAVIAPAALASAQARADVVLGFTGILAPGAFTVGNSGKLIGSTIPGAAVFTPSQLTLTGSDAVGGCQGGTYGLPGPCELRALVSASGQFTFNWAYSTVDSDGPPGDIFGVLVDGLRVQLSDPGGAITQSGVRGFTVRNSFGWYLNCSDCQGRRATGTVGNLDFVPESPGR